MFAVADDVVVVVVVCDRAPLLHSPPLSSQFRREREKIVKRQLQTPGDLIKGYSVDNKAL